MDSRKAKKIAILSGSMTRQSNTRKVLWFSQRVLENLGAKVDFLCVRDLQLPMMDPDMNDEPPEVRYLRDTMRSADAVLVGSPEYHSGPSGALKNAVDYLNYKHFEDKRVALVAMAGGPRGGVNTLNSLRLTFRALQANVLSSQIALCSEDIGVAGDITDPKIARVLEKLLMDLVSSKSF